jgi:hypothetical protein
MDIKPGGWVIVEVNDGMPTFVTDTTHQTKTDAIEALVQDYLDRGVETDRRWLVLGIGDDIQVSEGIEWIRYSDGKGVWDVWIWKVGATR